MGSSSGSWTFPSPRLREAFREREVTATLQCAGNRRAGLMAIRDIPGEAPWGPGATGTATWTGVALADVLALAGPLLEAAHVGFEGADLCPQAEPAQRFGGSIPLDKACRPEVLLAWGMNGEPLPARPRRAAARGRARLHRRAQREVARADRGPLHRLAGVLPARRLSAVARGRDPGPGVGMPLGLVALNSDVLSPADGDTVAAGPVEVRGYAFAGGERHVARVDVSLDGGASWSQAELLEDLGRWAWRQWRTTVRPRAGRPRDPRPRLGLLGGHAAGGRGGAVEPEGLREQRPPAGPGAGRRRLVSSATVADTGVHDASVRTARAHT